MQLHKKRGKILYYVLHSPVQTRFLQSPFLKSWKTRFLYSCHMNEMTHNMFAVTSFKNLTEISKSY